MILNVGQCTEHSLELFWDMEATWMLESFWDSGSISFENNDLFRLSSFFSGHTWANLLT